MNNCEEVELCRRGGRDGGFGCLQLTLPNSSFLGYPGKETGSSGRQAREGLNVGCVI